MQKQSESTARQVEKSEQEQRFTTLRRAITVSAREQGGDPSENLRLRLAIEQAEEANMPDDEIEQARMRGVDDGESPRLDEGTFEGYGPEDVAVFVKVITDDRARTRDELDEIFSSHDGNIGEDWCVAWQFDKRGLVMVDSLDVDDEDAFMLEVIEMGGDELKEPLYDPDDEGKVSAYSVYCAPEQLDALSDALAESGYRIRGASVTYEPTQTIQLERDAALRFLSFYEKLQKHEDVQDVWANWEPA